MFPFFLAKRFFFARQNSKDKARKASTPAIRIATAGIAVGIAVMILSVCVVKGFQREVSERLVGFTSHLEVIDQRSYGSPESYPLVTDEPLLQKIKDASGIVRVQRFSQKIGLLKTENHFAGVSLKGVGADYDLSFLRKHLVKGRMPDFGSGKADNEVVISRLLAERLGLKVGDKVYSYFFSETIKQRRLKISGIYETYIQQFDKSVVFADLRTVNKLNNWLETQSSGLEVRLSNIDLLPEVQFRLARTIGGKTDLQGGEYSIVSIYENPQTASMLSWLSLLDFNVMVILVIMVCVAGFTMVSGLLILILERTTTIGVLKALGASNRSIRHVFLWFAFLIVGRGLLVGNVIGLTLMALQNYFGFIHLNPETYYVDTVPVELNFWWLIGVNAASLAVTLLALIVPSFLVSRVQPAKTIQFD